jgi:hypothetical protein
MTFLTEFFVKLALFEMEKPFRLEPYFNEESDSCLKFSAGDTFTINIFLLYL